MACERCDGEGKVTYRIPPAREAVDKGNGVMVRDMGGHGTKACECVRDLPPAAGSATWWEMEELWSTVVPIPIGDEHVEITAEGEVPRGEDGRRVHRTAENFYYPALISVATQGNMMLLADDARALANALILAADVCDARDGDVLPF
jgi:hypothetical protein